MVVSVVVFVIVAGGGDEQNAGVGGPDDGAVKRWAVATATPGVVGGDDVEVVPGLQVGDVVNRLNRVGGGASEGAEELGGQK